MRMQMKIMKNKQKFDGKIVFISGGSKGIGFATAKEFLLEGAKVIICSRNNKNVDGAVKRLKATSPDIYGEVGDLSNEQTVIDIFEKINKKFGRIDVLVNCAGISKASKIENISLDEWNYILDNNLTNCFLTCKHVLKYMKKNKYGKIVNVSSIAGRFRSKLSGIHYTSSKGAIISFTRQLSAEIGKYNINANVICPSQTKTEMLEQFLTKETEKKLGESIPLGYIASPEQQANVILFLASEEASYITGAVIDVNGGQL